MSLDVYLNSKPYKYKCTCCECGHEHEIDKEDQLYQANITHNLGAMAEAAGIYKALWHPGTIGIIQASQLIEPLEKGLQILKQNPNDFSQYNAKNGWGLYDHFVPFVEEYLIACKQFPEASVEVSV